MTKKKSNQNGYLHTVRSELMPAIAANIFVGTGHDGHTYLYFKLSRSWKTEKREGYSDKFYDRNAEALVEVIERACRWIGENPQTADGAAQPQAA